LSVDEVLLQAHHADDQAETILLRLMRGTGMTGLAAIPPQRDLELANSSSKTATLVRPLLSMTRQQLHEYAVAKNLSWIEDDSNFDIKFDRNYLRHEILPRLIERWPAAINTLARSASQIADDNQLLRDLGESDWQSCAATAANDEQALTVKGLLDLSQSRRNNAIRSWLMQRELPLPDAAMLQRLTDELLLARIDATPCLQWANLEAHRYANRLFVFPMLPGCDLDTEYTWNTSQPLLIDGVGILTVSVVHEEALTVRFRRGGERCQPEGRAHSQTVKKLMQEYRVPPWLRDRVPMIYRGEELIAVAGYWLCEGSQLPVVSLNWFR
jgi:tRNA(Ile)-lysidine synthase